ncbi:MAG: fasciclin domain-containing protein [Verrucomicrobia bacterium]|nr:fasciclin domain-containing protein [Deltaproteobacteria bacterium]
MKTILETLAEDGSFQTLLLTLNQTKLIGKLEEPGPFTLFAPNDQSFERVNLEEISKDIDNLTQILTYHILSGTMTAAEIDRSESLYTESGKSLTVHIEEGKSVVDNGNLVRTDIECSNGIIHVIDNVFLPQFSGWYCGCC